MNKSQEDLEDQVGIQDPIASEAPEELPLNPMESGKEEPKVEEQKQVVEDQNNLLVFNDTSGASVKQPIMSESMSEKDLMEDAYYQELEEVVDAALHSITAKIAEKKAVELENSSIKVMISKVKEDIKREDQTQKGLKKAIEQEKDTRKKHEKDSRELAQTLELMNNKAESRREEIIQKLQETQNYYEELKDSTAKERTKIESIRTQLKDMAVEVRNEIRSLELANAEAIGFLDELKKKSEYDKLVKNDRLKTIKQKSKILAALIAQDNTGTKLTPRKNATRASRTSLK